MSTLSATMTQETKGMWLGLMGVAKISDVTRDYVQRARPVTPPHEMSAWVNQGYFTKTTGDGRIL